MLVVALGLLPLAGPASGEGSAVAWEAEAGVVSGVAHTLSDAGASGGGAVEFGRTDPSPGVTVSGPRFLRNGVPWVPRGLSLIGALSPDNTGAGGEANAHLNGTLMREAKAWGADAVRFNVSQRGLDPQDSLYSSAYVERVRQAVALSRSFGFAVILSVQDQGLGGGNRHPQPSPATLRDWQTLTSMFNDDREVIYEIFTEPQNKADAAGWAVWRNGGPAADNLGDPAVGHQAVLDAIRATGSTNLVLADGAQFGHNLEGIPVLSDPLGKLGYAIHPYISSVTRDPANWDAAFGDAAATLPVLNTAWNAHSESSSCDAEWPEKAALLVDYMEARDIGQFGVGLRHPRDTRPGLGLHAHELRGLHLWCGRQRSR